MFVRTKNPKMKKIELIRYFSSKFKHIIPGSTIHDILKITEKYINEHVNKFRARESKYPEEALFLWLVLFIILMRPLNF